MRSIVIPVLLWLLSACSSTAEITPTVSQAWLRLAPPTAEVLAGYFVLANPAEQPLRLVAITSPDFAAVEFHGVQHIAGQARMQKLNTVEVPSKSQKHFSPNADHLMLIQPKRQLGLGDVVNIEISALIGEAPLNLSIAMPVRQQAP